MDKDSTVTLSGFCEHVISKTQSEIYRITGSSSLKIQDGKARVIVQNEKSDTWVLRRDWAKVFEKMTPQKAADFKITSYKDVLDEMAEYFMNGDDFKNATFLCKITETNKA